MEPARDEREYLYPDQVAPMVSVPQWSPLGMSGNTSRHKLWPASTNLPQWSPLGMSGNTAAYIRRVIAQNPAAMEPARDEREYSYDREGVHP